MHALMLNAEFLKVLSFHFLQLGPFLAHLMDSLYTLLAPYVPIPKAFTAGWVSVILSHLRVLLEHNQRCCISLNKYGVFRGERQFLGIPRGNSLLKLVQAEALQSRRQQEPLLNTSCVPTNTPQSTERRDTTAEARDKLVWTASGGRDFQLRKLLKMFGSAFAVSIQYAIPKALLNVWKKLLGAVLRDRKQEMKAQKEGELSVPLIPWCVELARRGALSQRATMRVGFDCLQEPKPKF